MLNETKSTFTTKIIRNIIIEKDIMYSTNSMNLNYEILAWHY